ncbi:hypothetical protein B0H10DRAFT_2185618 [Mycena sp. CBHHK59/15]|nr:hypothetical protein B0H10DRAFT_2185618 [Mycena sp. CBHHK59/15]
MRLRTSRRTDRCHSPPARCAAKAKERRGFTQQSRDQKKYTKNCEHTRRFSMKASLANHHKILLYETLDRVIQGLNDIVMDVNSRGPRKLRNQEKRDLRKHKLPCKSVTDIVHAADGIPEHKRTKLAKAALESLLTAEERHLLRQCMKVKDTIMSTAIKLTEGYDIDRKSIIDFINNSPMRVRQEDGEDTQLFPDDLDSTSELLANRISELQERIGARKGKGVKRARIS